MYVGRFENENGSTYQIIDERTVANLPEPNGNPFNHAHGRLLVVFQVPKEYEPEAIWRAKKGWLNDYIAWEYNGVNQENNSTL
jgi:hypothetical protein